MGPLVITLLVAAGDGGAADTQAVLQALAEALGEARAVSREAPGPLTDEALLEAERASESDVTAAVIWSDGKLAARLRVHLRGPDRWIERGLTFAPSDDLRERGRTVGFTMASMLPDRAPAPRAARSPPPPVVAAAPEPAPPPRLAIDLMVMGSLGVGGNADAIGGAFALRRTLTPSLAVRAELLGRTGVVQAAEATSLSLHLAAGLAWSPLGDPVTHRASLVIRSDLAVFYESLGHLSPDDVDRDREARLIPGADLVLEGSLRVLGSAAVVLGMGAEVAFGRTDIYVHRVKVAVVPPLRLVTSLGLRHYF